MRTPTLAVAVCALAVADRAFAQGTVVFSGYNSLGTTHVWAPSATSPWLSLSGNGSNDSPSGTTPYAACGMMLVGANGTGGHWGNSTTFAQLLWANGAGQPQASLRPGGQTTTFRTGNTLGRITMITDTITGLTPDSAAATFEMVAWDNSSGQFPTWSQASEAWKSGLIGAGMSEVFTVRDIGGQWNTPPCVLAPSFNLYPGPEPSPLALGCLGLACLFLRLKARMPDRPGRAGLNSRGQ